MLSDISDTSSEDDAIDDDEFDPKKKKRLKTRKRDDRPKQTTTATNEQPSVYSSAEIRRHQKRLKRLKALEQGYESGSESESENENVDPDLDINFRIFESSAASTENRIVGEIQCNVKADDNATTIHAHDKSSKNSSVFKLSVNANFDEKNTQEKDTTDEQLEDDEDSDGIEKEINDILSMDSCNDVTDDSDLEILMSKPLVRRRAAVPPTRKEKPVVDESADKKITVYDLICETVRNKGNDDFDEDKPGEGKVESKKKNDNAKTKTEIINEAPSEEIIEKLETNKSSFKVPLGVPQVKVTADGQVVVDMDSLVVEETGLSERRNAIANSEVIEESGSTYRSYSKKRSFPKQWSPQDTLKFYHILSTIGTDFSLMATLFPGRTRTCMKRKFKREEKMHSDLIMKALSCRQTFDMDLLEKELRIKEERVNKLRESCKAQKVRKPKKQKTSEEEEEKKKKKSSKKPTTKKPRRRTTQPQVLNCASPTDKSMSVTTSLVTG